MGVFKSTGSTSWWVTVNNPRGLMAMRGALACALLSGLLSACLNNNLTTPDRYALTDQIDTESNGDTGGEGDTSTILSLSQVVRTNSNAASELDLIGDGSGGMGRFCVASDNGGANDGTGASTCTCEYSYTRSDGSAEVLEVDTSYHELDLIRCASTGIPTNVSFFTVRVHVTSSDTYSNSVTFRVGSDSVTLNTSDESSFLPVTRFQCRESLFVSYAFDNNFYDPFQSEDPRLVYPMNFYTTNMGDSIARFVDSVQIVGGAGFVCPTNTNDPTQGVDLTLYSISSDGGSNRIFPVTGSLHDRSNFVLAREATGVFSVPISALLAPSVTTGVQNANGSTAPALGFAAEPVPGSEADEETCPTDVEIPDGYQWAKLWLFRSSLAKRKAIFPDQLMASGGLLCNPGTWQTADTDTDGQLDAVIPDCGTNGGTVADSEAGSSTLADRIYSISSTQVCLNLQDGANTFDPGVNACPNNTNHTGAGCTTDINTGSQISSSFDIFRAGSDIWQFAAGATDACATTGGYPDPFNLCETVDGFNTPHQEDGATTDVDAQERFDFLFVVSPPEITTADMKAEDSAARPYIPFRFFQSSDCISGNPDAPAFSGDCSINRKIDYRFVAYSIDTQGDAPADDPDRLPDFPVCVLQVAP